MFLKPEFAALLQNNDVPSESAIREVTESLKAPLNGLQEVEAEIQRLDELMETMKMKRQSFQKIIDDHNVILSPARRLPPDVLYEIFFHCLPTHHNPVMKYSESPLLLTRICSSWRALALSSPRIWSKIYIPLPGDPSFSSGYGIITDEITLSKRRQRFASVLRLRCDAVRRWLLRSGTCPLSLSVTYPGYYSGGIQDSKDDELAHEMFNILLLFADRWRDVELSMPEDIYDKLQSNINPTTLSSLKSLKVTLYQKSHWENTQPTPIRLLAAPGLRRITISGTQTIHMTGNLVQPIWNQITHLTFASSTTDIYFLVPLRQCPNLVFGKFIVNSSPWPPQTIVDQGPVLLPRLESLAINDSGAHETMTIIFNAIKAPALTRLSYLWFNHHSPGDDSTIPLPTPVIPLLENSTLIGDLSLDGGLSSHDTQECLRRGERVTRVAFGKPPPTTASGHHLFPPPFTDPDVVRPDHFDLKILSIGSGAVTLLPRLGSLEAHHLSSLTDEDLLDVITSRINAFQRGETAALRSVKIDFQRPRQKDITEDVTRLAKEAGIEVKLDLTYPSEGYRFFDRLSPSFGFTSNDDMWSSETI
jgi:uncharacterized protein YqcC (DUF446 family)